MITEELIRFDKNNLSFKELIYNKYKPHQKIIGLFTITIGLSLLYISFIIWNYHLFWTIPVTIILLTFASLYIRKVNWSIILDKYKDKFKFEVYNKWDFSIIWIIRDKLLKSFIHKNKISDSNIVYIIESLKYKNSSNSYEFKFSYTIIPVILSAITAGFVSYFLNVEMKYKTLIILSKISILLIVTIFYFELFVLKEFILKRNNRYKRLISCLYNYLSETNN